MDNTIGMRIKKVRKREGKTQQVFADMLGLKQNTIATYEMGRNMPMDHIIKSICEKFHINETWLRTGEGEMDAPINQEEDLMNWITEIFQSPTDDARRRVIAVLAKLPPEWYQVLVDAALAEAERCKKERGEA